MARTLELTTTETQVAVWLAEGKSVRDMAEATGPDVEPEGTRARAARHGRPLARQRAGPCRTGKNAHAGAGRLT